MRQFIYDCNQHTENNKNVNKIVQENRQLKVCKIVDMAGFWKSILQGIFEQLKVAGKMCS